MLASLDALVLAPGFQHSSFDHLCFLHRTGQWGFVGFDRVRTDRPEERFSRMRSVGLLTGDAVLGRALVPLLAWLAHDLNTHRSLEIDGHISSSGGGSSSSGTVGACGGGVTPGPADAGVQCLHLLGRLLLDSVSTDPHNSVIAQFFHEKPDLSKAYCCYCEMYGLSTGLSIGLCQPLGAPAACCRLWTPSLLAVWRALLLRRRVLIYSKVGLGRVCDLARQLLSLLSVKSASNPDPTSGITPLLFRTGMYRLTESGSGAAAVGAAHTGAHTGDSGSRCGWLMVTSDASLIEQGVHFDCDWEMLVIFDTILDATNADTETRVVLAREGGATAMESIGTATPTVSHRDLGYTLRLSTVPTEAGTGGRARPPLSESVLFAPALDTALWERVGSSSDDSDLTSSCMRFASWWQGLFAEVVAAATTAAATTAATTTAAATTAAAEQERWIDESFLHAASRRYGLPMEYLPWLCEVCFASGIDVRACSQGLVPTALVPAGTTRVSRLLSRVANLVSCGGSICRRIETE
jgi:hypothetical protein